MSDVQKEERQDFQESKDNYSYAELKRNTDYTNINFQRLNILRFLRSVEQKIVSSFQVNISGHVFGHKEEKLKLSFTSDLFKLVKKFFCLWFYTES